MKENAFFGGNERGVIEGLSATKSGYLSRFWREASESCCGSVLQEVAPERWSKSRCPFEGALYRDGPAAFATDPPPVSFPTHFDVTGRSTFCGP